MESRDSPDEAAFRDGLRRWLRSNVPSGWRDATTRPDADRLYRQWHTSFYQAGYMGMSWPVE